MDGGCTLWLDYSLLMGSYVRIARYIPAVAELLVERRYTLYDVMVSR